MLHTKFQGHRPFDSGGEDFLRFLPYEPRHEKTCLRGLRPGKTHTGLLSQRDQLES